MTEKDGKTLHVHGIGDIVKISVFKDLYNYLRIHDDQFSHD